VKNVHTGRSAAAADEAEKADDTEKVIDTVILPQFDIANQNEKNTDDECMDTVLLEVPKPPQAPKKHWTGQSAYSEVC